MPLHGLTNALSCDRCPRVEEGVKGIETEEVAMGRSRWRTWATIPRLSKIVQAVGTAVRENWFLSNALWKTGSARMDVV
jgi:hypothetical protein